jgi:hypothetical protein
MSAFLVYEDFPIDPICLADSLFGKNALEVIGFQSSPPTWANQTIYSWRDAAHRGTARGPLIPIKGIDYVNVFHRTRATTRPALWR